MDSTTKIDIFGITIIGESLTKTQHSHKKRDTYCDLLKRILCQHMKENAITLTNYWFRDL
jgi:hypothetical protein